MRYLKLFLTLILFLTTLASYGQKKIQYIVVNFSDSYSSDSIKFFIDTTGLDKIQKADLAPMFRKFKSENTLYNELGKLGWEIYFIEDSPNKITQAKDNYSGRPIEGNFNLWRDWQYNKRKVYFKRIYE